MILQPIHYVFLGVTTFATLIWTLGSMGIIKPRNNELYQAKEKHIEEAVRTIEETFSIMEGIPAINRTAIVEHLENGEYNRALGAARVHHDVYHFFQNY